MRAGGNRVTELVDETDNGLHAKTIGRHIVADRKRGKLERVNRGKDDERGTERRDGERIDRRTQNVCALGMKLEVGVRRGTTGGRRSDLGSRHRSSQRLGIDSHHNTVNGVWPGNDIIAELVENLHDGTGAQIRPGHDISHRLRHKGEIVRTSKDFKHVTRRRGQRADSGDKPVGRRHGIDLQIVKRGRNTARA